MALLDAAGEEDEEDEEVGHGPADEVDEDRHADERARVGGAPVAAPGVEGARVGGGVRGVGSRLPVPVPVAVVGMGVERADAEEARPDRVDRPGAPPAAPPQAVVEERGGEVDVGRRQVVDGVEDRGVLEDEY